MYHLVARSRHRAFLWTTWTEGCALWERIVRCSPGRVALVVMPDHIHLLHPEDIRLRLAQALAGHSRALGRSCLRPLPPAEPLVDRQKIRRSVRYVHLNPCRAGLCHDPLEWPLSTHRDACGLMVDPVVRPRSDAPRFHRYVSSDPTVRIDGSELPGDQLGCFPPQLVLEAVSAVTRCPTSDLRRKTPARALYLAAARELSDGTFAEIGAHAGVHRTSVGRATARRSDLDKVRRVLGDERFGPLAAQDLTRLPAWRTYQRRR